MTKSKLIISTAAPAKRKYFPLCMHACASQPRWIDFCWINWHRGMRHTAAAPAIDSVDDVPFEFLFYFLWLKKEAQITSRKLWRQTNKETNKNAGKKILIQWCNILLLPIISLVSMWRQKYIYVLSEWKTKFFFGIHHLYTCLHRFEILINWNVFVLRRKISNLSENAFFSSSASLRKTNKQTSRTTAETTAFFLLDK